MSTDLGIAGLGPAEQVGAGGNAVVYRARHMDLDRTVAVKLMRAAHDADARRRFDRERRAMAGLPAHPGIAPVYSSGATATGEPYLVMPFYSRGSLQSEPPAEDWRSAVGDIASVADAIAHAHSHGVLHRDLKPGNIMRGDDGSPVVVDFGIAALVDETQSSSVALTPSYAPPEAFDGATPGPETDVYGLGASLHALLSGSDPFGLEGGGVWRAIQIVQSAPPLPLGDQVPDAVCRIIERSMAKSAADRYAGAAEMRDDLRRVLADPESHIEVPVPMVTPALVDSPGADPVSDSPAQGQERGPRLAVVIGAVLAAGVVAAGLFFLGGRALLGDTTSEPTIGEPSDSPTETAGASSEAAATAEPTAAVPATAEPTAAVPATAEPTAAPTGAQPVETGNRASRITPVPEPIYADLESGCFDTFGVCLGDSLDEVLAIRGLPDGGSEFTWRALDVVFREWSIEGGGRLQVWVIDDRVVEMKVDLTNLRELAGRDPILVEPGISLLETDFDRLLEVRAEPFLIGYYDSNGGHFPYAWWCSDSGSHSIRYSALIGNDNEDLLAGFREWAVQARAAGPDEPTLAALIAGARIGAIELTADPFQHEPTGCGITNSQQRWCADVQDALNVRSSPELAAPVVASVGSGDCSLFTEPRTRIEPSAVFQDALVWVPVVVDGASGTLQGWAAAEFLESPLGDS